MVALRLALLRGVEVRIITPDLNDNWLVRNASNVYLEELARMGGRICFFQQGFMHQKVMLVDDLVSSVGTHNFDNRSFRLNFEVSAVIVDPDFAGEMEAMLEADFRHAVPIDPEALEQKPLWWRAGVQLSRLAAPAPGRLQLECLGVRADDRDVDRIVANCSARRRRARPRPMSRHGSARCRRAACSTGATRRNPSPG